MLRQLASMVRGSVLRSRVLSLAKTCSIGLRSGEERGRKNSLAPAVRIRRRTALPLWLPRLSMTTTSPGLRVGTRNCSDIGAETGAVNRSVDDAGRSDAVMAQGCQKEPAPAQVFCVGRLARRCAVVASCVLLAGAADAGRGAARPGSPTAALASISTGCRKTAPPTIAAFATAPNAMPTSTPSSPTTITPACGVSITKHSPSSSRNSRDTLRSPYSSRCR